LGENIVTSIVGSLTASSLSNLNAKSAHAHILHSHHALRDIVVTDMSFRQPAVIEFILKEGNSAAVIYQRLHDMYGDVCMGVSSVRR
jgi:hypothetical protein